MGMAMILLVGQWGGGVGVCWFFMKKTPWGESRRVLPWGAKCQTIRSVKLLHNTNKRARVECAKEVIDVVPSVTFVIREIAAKNLLEGLTLPQLRAMGIIRKRPNESLSMISLHLSLTVSSVSRLIDGLVDRGLVLRQTVPDNRRQVSLSLTAAGDKVLDALHVLIEERIADRLTHATDEELAQVSAGLKVLGRLMTPKEPMEDEAAE
jgi:DNA-binding MarR family transcriptional regulator